MVRISWKALIFGLSADFVATIMAGLVLSVAGTAILVVQGRSVSELRAFHLRQPFLAALLVGMCGATFVGGFVAARAANVSPVGHGVVMGVLSLAIGQLLTRSAIYPAWFNALAAGLALPAGIAGGLAARARIRRTGPSILR
jgi:hypothetical protein